MTREEADRLIDEAERLLDEGHVREEPDVWTRNDVQGVPAAVGFAEIAADLASAGDQDRAS